MIVDRRDLSTESTIGSQDVSATTKFDLSTTATFHKQDGSTTIFDSQDISTDSNISTLDSQYDSTKSTISTFDGQDVSATTLDSQDESTESATFISGGQGVFTESTLNSQETTASNLDTRDFILDSTQKLSPTVTALKIATETLDIVEVTTEEVYVEETTGSIFDSQNSANSEKTTATAFDITSDIEGSGLAVEVATEAAYADDTYDYEEVEIVEDSLEEEEEEGFVPDTTDSVPDSQRTITMPKLDTTTQSSNEEEDLDEGEEGDGGPLQRPVLRLDDKLAGANDSLIYYYTPNITIR